MGGPIAGCAPPRLQQPAAGWQAFCAAIFLARVSCAVDPPRAIVDSALSARPGRRLTHPQHNVTMAKLRLVCALALLALLVSSAR